MPQFKFSILIVLCSILLSCSRGGVDECSISAQNKIVHKIILDRYLWYQDVPLTLNYTDFDSPEQTLDFLKVEKDRFSNIANAAEFDSLINQGQVIKFGFSALVKSDNSVQIKYVFDDSAAGRASLERGDKILSINTQSVEQLILTLSWDGIFGPDVEGYQVDMQVRTGTDAGVPHQSKEISCCYVNRGF